MSDRIRTLMLTAALALVVFPAVAQPAQAKVTTAKAIWGPLEWAGKPTMPEYAKLGVGIYQLQLRWERVAPTKPANPRDPADPAYQWPEAVDEAINAGRPHGIQVLLLVQGAPTWANGGKPWNFPASSPSGYADFMTAAARRYPAVKRWMIWGEPNGFGMEPSGPAAGNFQGVEWDRGKPLPRSKREGVELYARYVDAAYRRLKAESRRNIVIGGNTWAAGAVRPLHWIRALRLPSGKAPRMDMYGHNPGSERKPNIRLNPQARGTADFSDLDLLERTIDKNLGRRANGKRLGIFLSEWSLLTEHPIPGIDFFVTPAEQASWIKAGMRIVRRSKRVETLGIHRYNDEEHLPNRRHAHWGLVDENGNPKPSFQAFADS